MIATTLDELKETEKLFSRHQARLDYYFSKIKQENDLHRFLYQENSMEELFQLYLTLHSDDIADISKPEILLSGCCCLCAGILINLLEHPDYIELESLCLVNSLYMYIDNYLDDPAISSLDKKELATKIYQLFAQYSSDPSSISISNSSFTDKILNYAHKLLIQNPHCTTEIFEAFDSEYAGLKIQRNTNYPLDSYLQSSIDKGGKTSVLLYAVGTKAEDYQPDEDHYRIGAIIQILDDILDLTEDNADSIATIATQLYNQEKSLDILLAWVLQESEKLSKTFQVLAVYFDLAVLYCILVRKRASISCQNNYKKYIRYTSSSLDKIYDLCCKQISLCCQKYGNE